MRITSDELTVAQRIYNRSQIILIRQTIFDWLFERPSGVNLRIQPSRDNSILIIDLRVCMHWIGVFYAYLWPTVAWPIGLDLLCPRTHLSTHHLSINLLFVL